MTLGRTSSGAIKIKTDSPGLRAVECACCATLSCGCYVVSGALKTAIESATSVSVNGTSAAWNPAGTQVLNSIPKPSAQISYSAGVLCITADNGLTTSWLLPDGQTIADCPGNAGSFFPPGPDSIIVNGTALNAANWFGDTMSPTPTIVFS
jgi:hypothetical protein